MSVKSFESPDDLVMEDFIRVADRVYADDPFYTPTPSKQQAACFDHSKNRFYEYGVSRQFVAYRDGEPVARCSAGINPKMDREGERVGTIGFLETINQRQVFNELLESALDWLHAAGVKAVYGPMNFSIWQGYRCKTEGFDMEPYLGEPYNRPWYGELFENYGFTVAGRWHSFRINLREGSEALAIKQKKFESRWERAKGAGYEFHLATGPSDKDPVLREVYELVMESFSRFPVFHPISWEEFRDIYGNLGKLISRNQLVLPRKQGELFGFLIQHWDWARLLRRCDGKPGLFTALQLKFGPRPEAWIVSAGGISPKQKGLTGGALAHISLKEALAQGAKELIVSLSSEKNLSNAYVIGLDARKTTYALYQTRL